MAGRRGSVSVLRRIDPLTAELLQLDSWALLGELGGPTLARLPGTGDARARAVVVLQHGDEHTGLDALLEVLRTHPPLPNDLHELFGTIVAALPPPCSHTACCRASRTSTAPRAPTAPPRSATTR